MPLLEGENVTKSFGGLTAVYNVDFYLDPKEIVGLIGPNGAGKSTLFNLISGALNFSTGMIRFKNLDITFLKPNQICRLGIARTFQLIKLFPNMTVFENVLLAALFGRAKDVGKDKARKEAMALIEFVGLDGIKETPARELTLANQKWLEVARGLATHPELLLLDELMAGMNSAEVTQAMNLVKKIRDKGIAIFMIEHVMKAIMTVCDRIIVLDHGVKIAEGLPAEIGANQKVVEIYLGE